ncbi:syndecan 1 [Actinopolyspora lacussalsi]|nr:syndecan 1 [Actinopolyspora lacussalsi]
MDHQEKRTEDGSGELCSDELLADLCPILFASLARSDQRRKGINYLLGLLRAPGRKTVRNIAAFLGDHVNEQSLHHFINDSTWDWKPLREALLRYLAHRDPPRAWVLRPMLIPKSGEHSVGVTRIFSPNRGQVLNAQQAVGVWGVSEAVCNPVNWRLNLPQAWLEDERKRECASVPHDSVAESMATTAVRAYLDLPARHELKQRPVVVDARGLGTTEMVEELRAEGVPQMTRITGDTTLIPNDPSLSGWGTEPALASNIIRAIRDSRTRVAPTPPNGTGTVELAATTRVSTLGRPGTTGHAKRGGRFLLMGIGRGGGTWPEELWLTDLTTAHTNALYRLARLDRYVERKSGEGAEQLGIMDFVGRSFAGWHRHFTLVSAAHVLYELGRHGQTSVFSSYRPDVEPAGRGTRPSKLP